MKSLKWFVCGMMMLAIYFTPISTFATQSVTWTYSGSLSTPIPSVTTGWIVEMYNDVNKDTVLSSITSFNSSDIPQGTSAHASDDVLVNQTTVSASSWSSFVNNVYGKNVYTVLFNSSSLVTATQAWIIDTNPTSLPASGNYTYTANSTPSTVGYGPITVGAVPEPSSLALIGVGLAAIALRRRFGK